jgi:hypothetical protein
VQDEETSAVLGQRGISTAKGREKGAKFEEAWSLEERRPGSDIVANPAGATCNLKMTFPESGR